MKIRVLGAGYAGVRAALDLDWRLGRRGVRVTLVNAGPDHELITELHRPAAGTRVSVLAVPLADIFAGTGVEVVQGTVTDIRLGDREFVVDGRRVFGFDYLVVALGSEPEYFSIPGLQEHSLTLRSLNSAENIRRHIDDMMDRARRTEDPGQRQAMLTIVVAGGGLTGVEFAGELADERIALALRHGLRPDEIRIVTVEAAPDILPGFDEPLVDAAVDMLLRKGVSLLLGTGIVGVDGDGVVLRDGTRLRSRTVVWSGGVRANRLVERVFTTRARGRAVVNRYLQSVDAPGVYVIGDAALALNPRTGQPVPPTAQHAVAQGRLAARNIWAEIVGRPLRAYTGRTAGVVATVGRGAGLARIGPLRMAGWLPAFLKDLNTWRYLHDLGGARLVFRALLRQRSLRWAGA